MGKIFTSLKLLGLFVLLTSAVSSYWNYPSLEEYGYPKKPTESKLNWYESPMGIFAIAIDNCPDDSEKPTFTAPNDLTIYTDANCNYDASVNATGDVTNETDNCSTGLQATFSDSVAAGSVAGSSVITRTWSLVDEAGNAADTQVQTITIEDTTVPTFTAPADLTIYTDANCNYDASVSATGDVTNEADNCSSGLQATFSDSVAAGSVAGSSVITRTWSLVDEAGNAAATQVQTITIEDNIAPTFTAPADVTIYTDANCNYDASITTTRDVTNEADNCSTGLQATFSDLVAAGSVAGSFVITRTWSLVDEAGNAAATQVQTITVEDNTAPTFTAPADVTIYTDANCNYDASVTTTGDVTNEADNCSTGLQATFSDSVAAGSVEGSSIITRTWSLVDEAGNAAATQVQTITIEDTTVPTFTAPADLTIYTDANCNYDASESATGDVTNEADNCSTGLQATFSDSVAAGSVEGSSIITRTWSLVDEAGNAADTQVQTINVEDNTVPTFTAPADLTIYTDANCNYDANVTATGDVTNEADNCSSGLQATFSDSVAAGSVAGSSVITRTWSLVDEAGNAAATQVQTITIEDNIAPTFTAPADVTIYTDANCNYDASITTTRDVTNEADNCSTGLQATFSDLVAAGSVAGSFVITRTWSLVDEAGNAAATQVQTITVEDNTAPTFTAPADVTIYTDANCNYDASVTTTGDVTNEADNCSTGLQVTFSDSVTSGSVAGSSVITRTWSLVDEAGNAAATQAQTITVEDNTNPTASNPAPINVQCAADVPAADISVVTDEADNCTSNPTVAFVSDASDNNSNPETITRTYSVTDEAGNILEIQQTITIDDTEPPTPPQLQDIFWGCEYTVEPPIATDNCDTYVSVSANRSTTFTESGTVIWTFTDDAGNTSTASQEVIIDPLAISETIAPVSCYGGNDGSVTIIASGGNPRYQYKIDGGNYASSNSFSNLLAGDYVLYVKDFKGCETSKTVTVVEPDELSMTTPSFTEVTCNGGSDGTVTAGNVTGGTSPYEYSVDNINFYSTTSFEGLTAGNHTIFVKDANNCALQVPITISQPGVLTGSLTKTNVSCFEGSDGSITVSNASGGHGTYEYSKDGTNWQTGNTFSGLTAGTYSISIRDAASPACVVNLNSAYVITQPTAPITASVTTTRTTSYGTATGSATANASGGTPGYTYEWRRKGEGNVLQSTKTATNLIAGLYEVTVIDTKGCKLVQELEIIDAIQAFILTRSTCEIEGDIDAIRTFHYIVEDETAYGGVAPYSYSWNFGDGATEPQRSGIGEFWVDYTTIGNKTITLTVTDNTGATFTTTQEQYVGKCYNPCGRSSNIEFDPNNIYIGYADGTKMDKTSTDYCNPAIPKYIFLGVNKSANIYNPYIELTFIISNTILDFSNTYYADGCREKDDIDEDLTVNQPNRVGEFIKLTKNPINFNCGDNLNIDTFYITWTNVSKKECGANNNKFCWSTNEPLHVPTELRAEATPTNILCKGDSTGTITVKASGGFAPYSYRLSETATSQSSNKFVNLPAGTYTLYIQDSAGEETTATATIVEPDTAVSASTEATNPLCFGETGSATVTASGGTPFTTGEPYQYLWNDASEQTTATAINLTAGEYTVTVIDANGCQTIEDVVITQPEQLTVAETGPDQTFGCGFSNTVLNANEPVTGIGTWTVIDAPNTNWQLAEPNNPTSAFNAPAGTYTLRWTIAHADGTCGNSSDMLITVKGDCSTLDFDGIDDYVFIGDRNDFPSSDFSLEVWVKPESVQGIRTVVSKRNTANITSGGYDLVINNGAPTFRWNGKSVSTSYKVGTNRWYHLAVIFKGTTVELYVDGIKVGNSTGSKPIANSFPFLIGAMHNANNPEVPQNYFEGWIEELRVWNVALSTEQTRFMMNQRIEANGTAVKGEILPMNVPDDLEWSWLKSYYRLIAEDAQVVNGLAVDRAINGVDGHLRNIESLQQNTAPLPYISEADGQWKTRGAWDTNIGGEGENYWTWPNDIGINGASIDWNIAYVTHDLNSGSKDITLLGFLLNGGSLDMLGTVQTRSTTGSGNALTITRYLDLSGFIDLNGESQLIQPELSLLVGNGNLHRDQQGTASSYNYNYWSSPVNPPTSNVHYSVSSVMKDGANYNTDGTPKNLNFGNQYHYADGGFTTPRRVSTYWLHKFHGTANNYYEWVPIGSTGTLKVGEGFSMKGTSGYADVKDLQNYTFVGMPNNGTITLNIGVGEEGENYLVGNPYPSAIDAYEFILDNLGNRRAGQNVFNGSIYFWDHFSGASHYLQEYIGGYATYNLSGGVEAISNDERVNNNDEEGTKRPGQFIPVGQAFFVNSRLDPSITGSENISIHGGNITFKNSQRIFKREGTDKDPNGRDVSVFHSQERKGQKMASSTTTEERMRIWIKFRSPAGYHRQLLVTADKNATENFDLGYDGPLIENNKEDLYWLINKHNFVIQGVPDFNRYRILPVGMKTDKAGEFRIAIDEMENIPDEFPIYVKDSINDTFHNLRDSDFIAEAASGTVNNRYFIVFSTDEELGEDGGGLVEGEDGTGEDGETSGEEGVPGSNIGETQPDGSLGEMNLFYYSEGKSIILKNPDLLPIQRSTLYNNLGQELYHHPVQILEQETIPIEVNSKGVYYFKVFLEDGSKSLKFIVE